MFSWKTRIIVLFLLGSSIPCLAQGDVPTLVGRGMLASDTLSYCRGGKIAYGDLLYVKVWQPANIGCMFVSAHMQYQKNDEWVPVPAKSSVFGSHFVSHHYRGVRDYVKLRGSLESRSVNISLFVPYDAISLVLENQSYGRRYIIRIWDSNNREIGNRVLPEQRMLIQENGIRIYMESVRMVMEQRVRQINGRLVPYTVAKPVRESIVKNPLFFDAKTGKELDSNVHE